MTVPTLLVGASTTTQNVAFSGTHGTSTAITGHETLNTISVRLSATATCYYTTDGVTATSSNGALLPSGVIEYIRVVNGTKIDVVQSSASGTLNIIPMSDITTP